MPTKLTKSVTRQTDKRISGRDVVFTVVPSRGEVIFYFRLAGKRTYYPLVLADAYRQAALNYGNRMRIAKSQARKSGIPWARAKSRFLAENSPPKPTRKEVSQDES